MKKNSAYKHVLPFLVPTLVLALVLGIALLITPKAELHLALCQPHTTGLDTIIPIKEKIARAVIIKYARIA